MKQADAKTLYAAMDGIGEDLLERSEKKKKKRINRGVIAALSMAAAALIAIAAYPHLFSGRASSADVAHETAIRENAAKQASADVAGSAQDEAPQETGGGVLTESAAQEEEAAEEETLYALPLVSEQADQEAATHGASDDATLPGLSCGAQAILIGITSFGQ
ncbi:MAG: hypothetical protein IJQ12_05395 [Lachnospiraceae bacterium]|nr:hypothetical protein [Lachnospiraceae bacterium]